jgi:hypothetical protein
MRLKLAFPYHQVHSTAVDMGGIIIMQHVASFVY